MIILKDDNTGMYMLDLFVFLFVSTEFTLKIIKMIAIIKLIINKNKTLLFD